MKVIPDLYNFSEKFHQAFLKKQYKFNKSPPENWRIVNIILINSMRLELPVKTRKVNCKITVSMEETMA